LSANEFGAVASNDTLYASVSATTNYASGSATPAFMFKVNNSNNSNSYKIDSTVVAKSTVPTSTNPVYLQVYRGGGTNDWVTKATNNSTAADTDFTITSPTITASASEYYFNETPGIGSQYAACTTGTANCWSYWRIYQDPPSVSQNEVLNVNQVSVTYSPNGPDKVAFSNAARTLIRGACNGAASVFVMELQSGSTPTNPNATTVVRVTSSTSSYTIYSDSSCSSSVTNGDFTYSTSENSKNVYIIDNGNSGGTKTLTGTRQSGDTLTTGTQNYTLNGPDKVAFSNAARTLTAGTCNGAASVFVMELQSGTTLTAPFASTVVRITSNSSSYTIYSDSSCTATVTNGDFTYTTSENSKNVYIIDNKKSIITRTLSGTRQSGDTLTTGTQNYTVNAGSVTRLVITLPGETFTDGVGNSGTVLHQTSSRPFSISINATDSFFNLNTSYTGDKTLVFSGPGVGVLTPTVTDKNSANQNYGSNTIITFSNGTAIPVNTTLYKGESTTITATDAGSYGYASATLALDVPNTSLKGGLIIRGGTTIR
jgi:hypothetical protein